MSNTNLLRESQHGIEPIPQPVYTASQKAKLAATLRLVNEAVRGDAVAHNLLTQLATGRASVRVGREVLSTSDFANYLGHGIDAMLLDAYAGAPAAWRDYCHIGDPFTSMYRSVERYRITYDVSLLDESHEGEGLKYQNPGELYYTFKPHVYTGARAFTMHAILSDDLGGLTRTPQDLVRSAMATEEWFASSQFVANTTLYKDDTTGGRPAASGAMPAGNLLHLALTASNLEIAYNQFSRFWAESGIPIDNSPVYLVVPPALSLTARQIVRSTEIRPSGNADRDQVTANPVEGLLQVRVNPWIPYLDPTYGQKSWYLFSDPAKIWAVDISFYRGMERPFLFRELPTREPISGAGGAMMGSFETGGVSWGVQHIIGGSHTNAVGGWRATIWSDGTP